MEAQNKTNSGMRIMIGIMIILLLCAGVILYDFSKGRVVEINELSSRLASLKMLTGQAFVLRNIVETTKDDRSKLSMYFITKETIGSFIGELETYANRATVIITLSSPTVEKDKQISAEKFLKFNVRAEGSFENIMHFLDLIESMPYKLKLTAVKMGKVDSENVKFGLWFEEVTFNLVSYIDK